MDNLHLSQDEVRMLDDNVIIVYRSLIDLNSKINNEHGQLKSDMQSTIASLSQSLTMALNLKARLKNE